MDGEHYASPSHSVLPPVCPFKAHPVSKSVVFSLGHYNTSACLFLLTRLKDTSAYIPEAFKSLWKMPQMSNLLISHQALRVQPYRLIHIFLVGGGVVDQKSEFGHNCKRRFPHFFTSVVQFLSLHAGKLEVTAEIHCL